MLTFQSQQIIHFRFCSVRVPDRAALIPRINDLQSNTTRLRLGANTRALSADMQNYINAAIFTSHLSPTSFVCSTGNCTFPDVYRSAAWCSVCADVSDQLNITIKSTMVNYTLPSTNLTVSLYDGNTGQSFVVKDSGFGSNTTIQAIAVLPSPPRAKTPSTGSADMGRTWRDRGYGAAECTIYPGL